MSFRWRSRRYDPNVRHTLAYVPFPHDCSVVFNKNVTWGRVPINDKDTGEVQHLEDLGGIAVGERLGSP